MHLFNTIRILGLCFAAMLLSHCAESTAVVQEASAVVAPAPLPKRASKSATDYLALAKNQEGDAKNAALIAASKKYIDRGLWKEGVAILPETAELTPALADKKNILLAKVAGIRGHWDGVAEKINTVMEPSELPKSYQILVHSLLAAVHEHEGMWLEGVQERMQVEAMLKTQKRKRQALQALWTTLLRAPALELREADADLAGWLQAAALSKTENSDDFQAKITQWQSAFPQHPALQLIHPPQQAAPSPSHVAVLVPLTGPLAGPGSAIYEGLMAAFNADPLRGRCSIKTYDVGARAVEEGYAQALEEGADYIIGPLTKNDVAKVAGLEHPVPTLLLNDLDTAAMPNVYQLSLSPTFEAKQVAKKASSTGLSRALIIAPEGPWGTEVVAAFKKTWAQNQGEITETLIYSPQENLGKAIAKGLHMDKSGEREKEMKSLIEDPVETRLSRRQDFDMIFLVAYPTVARQIMPLLKYYFVQNVPVYATSTVYAGSANPSKDNDLNGLIFCDMPWVYSHQLANKNWPESWNSYNRLFALGQESYLVAKEMGRLQTFPSIASNEGILSLNKKQKVQRHLAWGRFEGGIARREEGYLF